LEVFEVFYTRLMRGEDAAGAVSAQACFHAGVRRGADEGVRQKKSEIALGGENTFNDAPRSDQLLAEQINLDVECL
jgi:hypothetical protein